MRITIGLAAIAAVWASPAMATDWWLVATTESKSSAAMVDRDSINELSKDVRRVSAMQVFAADTGSGANIAAMQAVMEYDCKGLQYRYISIVAFDVAGTKIGEQTGSATWRAIDKGAVNEAQLQFVCSSGTKPSDTVSFGSASPIVRARARLTNEKPGTYGGH